MYKIEDDMLVYNGVRYSYADAKEYGLIELIEAEEKSKISQKAAAAPEDKADEPEEDKAAAAPAGRARATARA